MPTQSDFSSKLTGIIVSSITISVIMATFNTNAMRFSILFSSCYTGWCLDETESHFSSEMLNLVIDIENIISEVCSMR